MKLIMCFYLKIFSEREFRKNPLLFPHFVSFPSNRDICVVISSSMTCFAFFKNAWNLSFLERKFSSVREKKCDLLLPVLCILYCSWNIERINFAQNCYLSLVCRLCCRVIWIFSSWGSILLVIPILKLWRVLCFVP